MVRIRPEGEASFATGTAWWRSTRWPWRPRTATRGWAPCSFAGCTSGPPSRDIDFVSLSVMAGNEEAERFYRRFGMARSVFRMLGPVPRRGLGESHRESPLAEPVLPT